MTMTESKIVALAKEAGFVVLPSASHPWRANHEALTRFATLLMAQQAEPADSSWQQFPTSIDLVKPAAPAVPDGWQPVPKKPTQEMLANADLYHRHSYVMDEFRPSKLYVGIYQAMLAAAPKGE